MSRIYSISEITNKIKTILENGVGYVGIEGEVSNFKSQTSGHLYFTLKDADAAISAVMFKSRALALRFALKDGLTVRAFGQVSVYQKRGQYQIIIDKMEMAGEGEILRMLEERKRRLSAEGLFDANRKKSLPFFPRKVAIITSATGAAVQDIINVCTRRNPKIQLIVLPAIVQGSEAAPSLVKQLKIANLHKLGDVIIIGRGGGSIEDLLPFSEEEVVREIANSTIPVISSVGHEIDWAISDFVADVRAPTPSAAAELATPILDDIIEEINDLSEKLLSAIEYRIEKLKLLCKNFDGEHLEMMFRRVEQPLLMRFDDAKEGLLYGMRDKLKEIKQYNAILRERLAGLSPRDVMRRGYAILTDESGKTIKKVKDVKTGEKLKVGVYDGSFDVEVL